jgi:hypothetical protein
MTPRQVAMCLEHKMGVYRPVLPDVRLRLLRTEAYLAAARDDRVVQQHLDLGWWDDFDVEFAEPVLADVDQGTVTACPPMYVRLVGSEPVRIQRAYIEGSFMRRMFRFLVAGVGWEADEQVRDVMARHFPFHLVTVESIEGQHAI